jgi:hypothetical protein
MNMSWNRRIGAVQRAREQRSLFMIGGAAASLLLLWFVFRGMLPAAGGIAPRLPAPEFSTFLPPGAELDGQPLEIVASPQTSYIVSYRTDGSAHIALIEWSRDEAAYRLTASVALAEGDVSLERAAAMSLQPMGVGESLILVRGPYGAYVEGVFVLARDSHGLGIVRLLAEDGLGGPAFFIEGASALHSEELAFEDMDGDGPREALVVSREANDGGVARTRATVYRFTDGKFMYDAELSRVLTITKSLFPEPPADLPVAADGDEASACAAHGAWNARSEDCETTDQAWCESAGGTYTECASACRMAGSFQAPPDSICTMQCVAVCRF